MYRDINETRLPCIDNKRKNENEKLSKKTEWGCDKSIYGGWIKEVGIRGVCVFCFSFPL